MKASVPLLALVAWIAVGLAPSAAQQNELTATGLFPTFDASGEAIGDDLATYLTPAIYESFKDMGRELVLLNPGGSYSLLDEAGALDYAKSAGVKTVLMPKFGMTERQSLKDNTPKLRVEMKILDVASAATLHSFALVQPVNRKDLEKGFDKGPGLHPFIVVFKKYSDKSRKVEKQELGKAMQAIADTVRTNTLGFNQGSLVYPSAALHQGPFPPSCNLDFSIKYTRQRSASKSYELFVNDSDETININNEGLVAFTVKPGLNLFTISVKDPPYRLPKQKTYTINRFMDCSATERHLVLEIGPGGEGLMVGSP